MTSWQTGDVTANGIRLHYTRTGGDKPPLVLTHGFSDDGLCWTSIAEVLASDFDVIMLDARGHGQSEAPEQGYAPRDHAADVAGVISELGLQKPIVMGHSMGAMTALAMASVYPDLPRAIVLEDPPAHWTTSSRSGPANQDWRARQLAWITGLQSKSREQVIADQRAEAPSWPEADLGPWADSKLRLSLNVLNAGPPPATDWASLFQRITCPVLLITADPESGAIVTEEQARALEGLVPQLRVAHIPGAGHNIRREQFDRYIKVVQSFLSEVGTQASGVN